MEAVVPHGSDAELRALEKILGLAIFGEKVAARNYLYMGEIDPQYRDLMRKFGQMEGRHGAAFEKVARRHGIRPDQEFAFNELGYLESQVEEYRAAGSFESIAVLQGFIVESLAIATYEPFVEAGSRYEGAVEVAAWAASEEHYHVDWVTRFLRLRFFDREDEFLELVQKVNVKGIDCVGGTMMNIVDCLDDIGMSGADCSGYMMDCYSKLLENVGIPADKAASSVVSLFMPVVRKYRRGEKTK